MASFLPQHLFPLLLWLPTSPGTSEVWQNALAQACASPIPFRLAQRLRIPSPRQCELAL